VEEDALNAVIGDAEQDRRKGCILVVEYERRLAVEFVYFSVEVRATPNPTIRRISS
jgi:hypothetical protein